MGLIATQSNASSVKCFIFHVSLKPSGNLLLAELDDGRLCLMRDDQPLPDCVWGPDEVASAVTTFRDIEFQLKNGLDEVSHVPAGRAKSA